MADKRPGKGNNYEMARLLMAFTYEYRCKCGIIDSIEAEYATCQQCGKKMERIRIIWNGAVQPNNFEPYFNNGLGRWVKKKSDVKEHLRQIKGEEGIEMEEIGNEDPRQPEPDFDKMADEALKDIF
jgi:tRNA G26 N,N-dimethylase Trm1